MLSNSFENSSKSIVYMNTCGKNLRSARSRVGFFRRKRFDTARTRGGDFSDGKDFTPRMRGVEHHPMGRGFGFCVYISVEFQESFFSKNWGRP